MSHRCGVIVSLLLLHGYEVIAFFLLFSFDDRAPYIRDKVKESVQNEKTKDNHFKLMENNPAQDAPQNKTLSSIDSKVPVTIMRARNKARCKRAFLRHFLGVQKVAKAHRGSGETKPAAIAAKINRSFSEIKAFLCVSVANLMMDNTILGIP